MQTLNPAEKTETLFRFNKKYFLLTIALFTIEVLIAAFVRDKFIRPYIGDFLVVILIYCFCKSFLNISSVKLAIGVLLFAYFVEITQYFQLIKLIGLQHSTAAKIILGNSFSWMDMLVYTLGILLVVFLESTKICNSFTALISAKS